MFTVYLPKDLQFCADSPVIYTISVMLRSQKYPSHTSNFSFAAYSHCFLAGPDLGGAGGFPPSFQWCHYEVEGLRASTQPSWHGFIVPYPYPPHCILWFCRQGDQDAWHHLLPFMKEGLGCDKEALCYDREELCCDWGGFVVMGGPQ